MEYQIGGFSCITRLSVKTLRFYHEEGLLLPARVDSLTAYRYYNNDSIERARLITTLRSFDFTIEEIKHVLAECREDADLRTILERKASQMHENAQLLQAKEKRINQLLRFIEEQKTMNTNQDILIKDFPAELVATIRFRGRYQDIGGYFSRLFKAGGSKMAGKPFALYHDPEYREDDADIEAGLPVRSAIAADGIESRTIPACRCLSIIHQGSYDTLSVSYEKLSTRLNELGLKSDLPTREVYLKGPGMLFRGNPRNYLTEIRLPLVSVSGPA